MNRKMLLADMLMMCCCAALLRWELWEGRGNFTAVVEVREARELGLAFFYHLAVQRLVRNPLEDHRSVAGITNYVDFGLQVQALTPHPPPPSRPQPFPSLVPDCSCPVARSF